MKSIPFSGPLARLDARTIACILPLASFCLAQTQAATLFSANFDNSSLTAAQSAVTSSSQLGTPSVGTWSGTAASQGRIAVNGTDKAYAIAHNTTAISNMTSMSAGGGVAVGNTYPATVAADSGAGSVLVAQFATSGKFSAPGENTTINFQWGGFGNNNTGGFKYDFVTGYDASGNQLFELLFVNGSTTDVREMFARGAGDSSTTVTSASLGTPQGSKVATGLSLGSNSTTGEPTDMIGVTISLENNQVRYGFEGGALSTAFSLNSSATEITQLRWSSSWNSTLANNQNKGYWLDDVSVTSVPEPAAALLGGFGLLGLLRRRR